MLVIKEKPGDGTLVAEQLSKDHSVENVDEMKRLVSLGLKREDLERSGRLGMHDNTRSIGDYYIKAGYRDVDVLRYEWNARLSVFLCFRARESWCPCAV